MTVRKLIFIIFIFVSPQLLFAFELTGIQLNIGTSMIFNAEDVSVSSAPSPVAAELLGVSVPMQFSDILYFEPGLRFFAMNVYLDPTTYKPVPAAIETADRVSVLGCELRPELGAIFHVGEGLELGVTGAPAFLFRFPITAYDAAGDTEKSVIFQYYLSSLRFVDLYVGGFFTWNFSEDTAIKIKVGTDLPVYHLWDGEVVAFYDQLRVTPEISLLWRF